MERIAEEYAPHNVEEVILPHAMGRGFFFYPEKLSVGKDKSYDSNSAFWIDVLNDKVIAERTVVLRRFNIFEWIPRNPGLYHTRQAAFARQEAQHHIRHASPQALAGSPVSKSPDHAAEFT